MAKRGLDESDPTRHKKHRHHGERVSSHDDKDGHLIMCRGDVLGNDERCKFVLSYVNSMSESSRIFQCAKMLFEHTIAMASYWYLQTACTHYSAKVASGKLSCVTIARTPADLCSPSKWSKVSKNTGGAYNFQSISRYFKCAILMSRDSAYIELNILNAMKANCPSDDRFLWLFAL